MQKDKTQNGGEVSHCYENRRLPLYIQQKEGNPGERDVGGGKKRTKRDKEGEDRKLKGEYLRKFLAGQRPEEGKRKGEKSFRSKPREKRSEVQ